MMKQKLFFCLFAVTALFTSCSSDDPTITVLTNDSTGAPITQISLGANKDTKGSVVFESSDDWEAKATLSDGTECNWLIISPAQGKAGKVSVTVKANSSNMTGEPRTATLTLYGDGKALQNLSVTQAKMDFIELDQSQLSMSISAQGGDVDIPFTCSLPENGLVQVAYSSSLKGWAQLSWLSNTRSLEQKALRVSVDANPFTGERSAQLQLRILNANDDVVMQTDVITLTQTAGPELTSTDESKDGEYKVLQTHSKGNVGIPLVILGDGFVDTQIASGYYDECMQRGIDNFFSEEPYTSLREYFDVWQVTAVSHSNVLDGKHKTAISSYPTGDGTLIEGDHSMALAYAQEVPQLQTIEALSELTILVVMNTDAYAGTCYFGFSFDGQTTSNLAVGYAPMIYGPRHEESRQVMVHENAGHGFAKLGDEYGYSSNGTAPQSLRDKLLSFQEIGWMMNISATGDPELVPWSRFLKDSRYTNDGNGFALGVLEGGYTYTNGIWKPTEDSMMGSNQDGFNAPSREAIYKRVMSMAYGSPWEYDYEEFVKFDQAHLPVNSAKTRAIQMEREGFDLLDKEEMKKRPLFHEPVFVGVVLLK